MNAKNYSFLALFLLASTALGFMAPRAEASPDNTAINDFRFNIAGLMGAGFFTNSTTNLTIGASAEYKLNPSWGAGLYFNYDSLGNVTVAGVGTLSRNFSDLAAELNYHFAGLASGLSVGGKAGLGWDSTTSSIPGTTTGTTTTTGFVFGPAVGYDYLIASGFSVGGQVNWLICTNQTGGGNLNVVNLLAQAKFWF